MQNRKEEVEKNPPRYGYGRKDSLHQALPLKSSHRRHHHLDAPASTSYQRQIHTKNRRPSLPPLSSSSSCRRRFSTSSEKRREEEEEERYVDEEDILSPFEEKRLGKQGAKEVLGEEGHESSDVGEEEETEDIQEEKSQSRTEKRKKKAARESAKDDMVYLQSEVLRYKTLAEKLQAKLDAREDSSKLSSQTREEDEEETNKNKKNREEANQEGGCLFDSQERENYWRDQAMKKDEELLQISQQLNHLNSLYQVSAVYREIADLLYSFFFSLYRSIYVSIHSYEYQDYLVPSSRYSPSTCLSTYIYMRIYLYIDI